MDKSKSDVPNRYARDAGWGLVTDRVLKGYAWRLSRLYHMGVYKDSTRMMLGVKKSSKVTYSTKGVVVGSDDYRYGRTDTTDVVVRMPIKVKSMLKNLVKAEYYDDLAGKALSNGATRESKKWKMRDSRKVNNNKAWMLNYSDRATALCRDAQMYLEAAAKTMELEATALRNAAKWYTRVNSGYPEFYTPDRVFNVLKGLCERFEVYNMIKYRITTDKHGGADYNVHSRVGRGLAIVTDTIEVTYGGETKRFGRYVITFDIGSVYDESLGVGVVWTVRPLGRRGIAGDEMVKAGVHPHIDRNGHFCMGEAEVGMTRAVNEGRLGDAAGLVIAVLSNYGGVPHIDWSQFDRGGLTYRHKRMRAVRLRDLLVRRYKDTEKAEERVKKVYGPNCLKGGSNSNGNLEPGQAEWGEEDGYEFITAFRCITCNNTIEEDEPGDLEEYVWRCEGCELCICEDCHRSCASCGNTYCEGCSALLYCEVCGEETCSTRCSTVASCEDCVGVYACEGCRDSKGWKTGFDDVLRCPTCVEKFDEKCDNCGECDDTCLMEDMDWCAECGEYFCGSCGITCGCEDEDEEEVEEEDEDDEVEEISNDEFRELAAESIAMTNEVLGGAGVRDVEDVEPAVGRPPMNSELTEGSV
jgi:hypothetical protein